MSEPVAIQASAGTDALTEAIIQSTVPKGAVITQEPILGEADKPAATGPEPHKPKSTTTEPEKAKTAAAESGKPEFFPANPSFPDKLAENKPVKELTKEGSGASSGIFRTISDVLVELRGKHQDKKRARQQSAEDAAQAKVRKEAPASPANSPTERQPSSPLKSFFSLGSPKRTASGADPSDDKVRAGCWSPSSQASNQSNLAPKERKPSLAQRYSTWKAVQSEKKDSKASSKTSLAGASTKATVPVSSDATAAKPAAPAKAAEPVVVSSDATSTEAAEVVSKDAVKGESA